MSCTVASSCSSLQLPPTSVRDFLERTPRSAYTTLLVRRGRALVDWEVHLERLLKSIRALDEVLSCYGRFNDWAKARGCVSARDLQPLLLPTMKACLAQLAQAQASIDDCMLVLALPPAGEPPHGFDVQACAAPYAHATGDSPATAVVLGGPRQVPVGKETGWVRQRQRLEALRPPGAAEVLLCSADGRLLEGLVTNVYVVAEAEDGGAAQAAGGESSGGGRGLVLWTAGMGEGVVWGTLRQRVLAAAAALGIAVLEQGPAMADRHRWREAFLTNALRGVQSLGRLVCDVRNDWGLPPWELELEVAPGPVTAAIAAAVTAATPETDLASL